MFRDRKIDSKGKQLYTFEDIINNYKKLINFEDTENNRWVRVYGKMVMITEKETDEIVSFRYGRINKMERFKQEIEKYQNIIKDEENAKDILNIFMSDFPYEDYNLDDTMIDYITEEMDNLDNMLINHKPILNDMKKILHDILKKLELDTK